MPVTYDSEDDDTDKLLQIPPDKYLVPSSEESVENFLTQQPIQNRGVEKYKSREEKQEIQVVYTLLAQIHILESRLAMIESNKPTNYYDSRSPNKRHLSPQKFRRRVSPASRRIIVNNGNTKNPITAYAQSTPKKPLQRPRLSSLPSTPTTGTEDIDDICRENKENNGQLKAPAPGMNMATRYDPSGNSLDSLNISFSPPKRRGTNLTLRELDKRFEATKETSKLSENADNLKRNCVANIMTSTEDDGDTTTTINDTDTNSFIYQDKAALDEIETFLKSVDCIKTHMKNKEASEKDVSFLTSPQLKAITHFNKKLVGNQSPTKSKKKLTKLIPNGDGERLDANSKEDKRDTNQQPPTSHAIETINNKTDSTLGSTISLMKSTISPNSTSISPNSTNPTTLNWLQSLGNESRTSPEYREVTLRSPNTLTNYREIQTKTLNVLMEPNPKACSSSIEMQISTDSMVGQNPKNVIKEALFVLNNLKQQTNKTNGEKSAENENIIKIPNHGQNLPDSKVSTPELPNPALMSLSSLWGKPQDSAISIQPQITAAVSIQEPLLQECVPTFILQKFEEERLRREHCEKLIEALQVRMLESQEKLSVAVKVDEAKDSAIEKLKNTFLVAQERCDRFQTERDRAINELKQIENKLEQETKETDKKIKHYEQEINQALEIARKSQSQTNELKHELNIMQSELERTVEDNKKLTTQVDDLHKDIEKDKLIISGIRNAATESKHQITSTRSQIEKLAEENKLLKVQINEERLNNSRLEAQSKNLQSSLELSKSNEKKLTTEKQNLLTEHERNKTELRELYQRQLDSVVKQKVNEFQTQLDTVEKNLLQQNETMKLEVVTTAAQYMRDTVEKHKFEVRLLEERHAEEMKLYKIEKQQNELMIEALQTKLKRHQASRAKLGNRLQNLIENQWKDALRIITTNGSPAGSEMSLVKQDSVANIQKILNDDLDGLEYEEVSNLDRRKYEYKRPHSAPDELPTSDRDGSNRMTTQNLHHQDTASSSRVSSTHSQVPFNIERRAIKYSDRFPKDLSDSNTPLTTRPPAAKEETTDMDLQRYIKMLLEDTDFQQIKSDDGFVFTKKYEPQSYKDCRLSDRSSKKLHKPPWK